MNIDAEILSVLKGCAFTLGAIWGTLFFSLFGKRWFF